MEINGLDFTHFMIHLFVFAILADVNINRIYYCKYRKTNVTDHVFLSVFIVVVVYSNHIFKYVKGLQYSNRIDLQSLEIALLTLMGIQVTLGIVLVRYIHKSLRYRHLLVWRSIHQFNGLLILVLGKAKVVYLLYYYTRDLNNVAFALVTIAFFLFTFIIYAGYYLYYFRNFNSEILLYGESTEVLYNDIRTCVETEEFMHEQSFHSEMQGVKDSLNEKSTIFSESCWVVFEDHLYDLKDFVHPGGNFVVKMCKGTDITKYVYGFSSLLVYDHDKKIYRIINYNHSFRTFNVFNRTCIGVFNKPPLFTEKAKSSQLRTSVSLATNLLDSRYALQTEKLNYQHRETIGMLFLPLKTFEIDFNRGLHLVLISKIAKNESPLYVDLNVYWIKMVGRYFLYSFKNSKKLLLYSTLSLNPTYLSLRNRYYKDMVPWMAEMDEAYKPDLVKELEAVGESEDNNFNICRYCSVIGYYNNKKDFKSFNLKGPFGLGLNFTSSSSQSFLVIIDNEGLIPFLDFIEIITQKELIIDSYQNIRGNTWIFTNEYKLCYNNGIQFYVYWQISRSFAESAKVLGLTQLQKYRFMTKRCNVAKPVIIDVFIKNNTLDFGVYDQLKKLKSDFSFDLANIIKHSKLGDFKVIISGSKNFQKDFVEKKAFPKNNDIQIFLI